MFRMLTGRHDCPQEEIEALLAEATERTAAAAAERAPRAASERASEHSTLLSRFDAGAADSAGQPAAEDANANPNLARWVLEARCEVLSDPVEQEPCWGYRHSVSTDGMALSGDATFKLLVRNSWSNLGLSEFYVNDVLALPFTLPAALTGSFATIGGGKVAAVHKLSLPEA